MQQEPGPAELIAKSGKTHLVLAAEAGVSLMTVLKAKQSNAWPAQLRTRTGLRRALGLDATPADAPRPGIRIDTVQQAEAVVAGLPKASA